MKKLTSLLLALLLSLSIVACDESEEEFPGGEAEEELQNQDDD
jgi:uncharacterized lipoprotein YehR (DUF1307 family)